MMITQEERETTNRICEVGTEKYVAALHVLAETLGIETNGDQRHDETAVKDELGRMLMWMRRNWNNRKEEFRSAGLELVYDPHEYGQYCQIDMVDRDMGRWTVKYQNFGCGDCGRFSIWGDGTWDTLLYLSRKGTASSAVGVVSSALKCLSRWQSLAVKYNVLKGTCAAAYEKDSLERAEKARHQLELLEKL